MSAEKDIRATQEAGLIQVFEEVPRSMLETVDEPLSLLSGILELEPADLQQPEDDQVTFMLEVFGIDHPVSPLEEMFLHRLEIQRQRLITSIATQHDVSKRITQRVNFAIASTIQATYNTISDIGTRHYSAHTIELEIEQMAETLLMAHRDPKTVRPEIISLRQHIKQCADSIEQCIGRTITPQGSLGEQSTLAEYLLSISDATFQVFVEFGGEANLSAQNLRNLYQEQFQSLKGLTAALLT